MEQWGLNPKKGRGSKKILGKKEKKRRRETLLIIASSLA